MDVQQLGVHSLGARCDRLLGGPELPPTLHESAWACAVAGAAIWPLGGAQGLTRVVYPANPTRLSDFLHRSQYSYIYFSQIARKRYDATAATLRARADSTIVCSYFPFSCPAFPQFKFAHKVAIWPQKANVASAFYGSPVATLRCLPACPRCRWQEGDEGREGASPN